MLNPNPTATGMTSDVYNLCISRSFQFRISSTGIEDHMDLGRNCFPQLACIFFFFFINIFMDYMQHICATRCFPIASLTNM